MKHLALAIVLALGWGPVLAQSVPSSLKVVDVSWIEVMDRAGHRTILPVFSRAASDPDPPPTGLFSVAEPSAVLARDEQWLQARVTGDSGVLAHILSDDFSETSDDGVSRNKSQALQLWSERRMSHVNTEQATIRISGNVATVAGEQVERSADGSDRLVFTRVYVKSVRSGWNLLVSTQHRPAK